MSKQQLIKSLLKIAKEYFNERNKATDAYHFGICYLLNYDEAHSFSEKLDKLNLNTESSGIVSGYLKKTYRYAFTKETAREYFKDRAYFCLVFAEYLKQKKGKL